MKDAIVAMLKTHNAPMTRAEYLAWAYFSKPQPYEPDPEEEMLIPKEFRLVEYGGKWHSEFEEETRGVQ